VSICIHYVHVYGPFLQLLDALQERRRDRSVSYWVGLGGAAGDVWGAGLD